MKAEFDAVVVGSGPAGAAAAHALVRSGASVLMLEAGQRPEADRFAAMERAVRGDSPWPFPPHVYETRGDEIALDEFAIRKLGGSSLAWGGVTPRLWPSDFRLKTRFGLGADWPLSYAELEPYYSAAERFMGVAGASDDPDGPHRSEPFPMPPFPMSDADRLVREAGRKVGIPFYSVPVARNSVPYGGRPACLGYAACRACPVGALYGADSTVARLERRPNFRLRVEAAVERVELNGGREAVRVVYRDGDGREHSAAGRRIILAVQSVETVRILLNSACGAFPAGLANDGGLVGRYFMNHPRFYLRGRVRERLDPFRLGFETAASTAFCDHARRADFAAGRLLVRENAGPSVTRIATESGLWGQPLLDEIREVFGHYVVLGSFLEQLPRADNRIGLSARLRDRHGVPAPRVDFRLMSAYEQDGYRVLRRAMERLLDALGAEDVEVLVPPASSGHYMGGHRMGRDPARSVTNADLETHAVKNLFLAGAGVFPTAGVGNPTLTTVALTLRMVDRMTGRRSRGPAPA